MLGRCAFEDQEEAGCTDDDDDMDGFGHDTSVFAPGLPQIHALLSVRLLF